MMSCLPILLHATACMRNSNDADLWHVQIYPMCHIGVNLCNSLKLECFCEVALLICQNTVVGPAKLLVEMSISMT